MCIFCKIINKEEKAELEYEDERVIVIKDIHPKAPIHLLIIPKKHIESIREAEDADKELLGELILTAKKVADAKKLDYYNLSINVGRGAGQLIDHIHVHLKSDAVRS